MKLSQFISITITLIVTASSANAQMSSTGALPDGTSVVQVNPEIKEDEKRFSIDLGLAVSEKMVKEEATPKENTTSLTIVPSYKFSDLLTLGGKIIINQENYAQRETTPSDATFSLGITGIELTSYLKTTHAIGTVAPVSKESVEENRLQGNISTTHGLAYTHDYFGISYKVGLARNFHEFTQNIAGAPNVEYRLSQIVELKVPFTEQLGFSGSGVYRIGRTYGGFERYGFIFDAEIYYEMVKSLTASIGTSNDGAALKANGVDSNIALWNENTSVISGGLTYSY